MDHEDTEEALGELLDDDISGVIREDKVVELLSLERLDPIVQPVQEVVVERGARRVHQEDFAGTQFKLWPFEDLCPVQVRLDALQTFIDLLMGKDPVVVKLDH